MNNLSSTNGYLLPKVQQKVPIPECELAHHYFSGFYRRKHKEGIRNVSVYRLGVLMDLNFLVRIRDAVYSSFTSMEEKIKTHDSFRAARKQLQHFKTSIYCLNQELYNPQISQDIHAYFLKDFTGTTPDMPNLSLMTFYGHYQGIKIALEKKPERGLRL